MLNFFEKDGQWFWQKDDGEPSIGYPSKAEARISFLESIKVEVKTEETEGNS